MRKDFRQLVMEGNIIATEAKEIYSKKRLELPSLERNFVSDSYWYWMGVQIGIECSFEKIGSKDKMDDLIKTAKDEIRNQS